MLKPGGYGVSFGPEGVISEQDTFTCFHCNCVVAVPVKARPEDIGGMCMVCMKLICPRCVGQGCKPFEEQIAQAERRSGA